MSQENVEIVREIWRAFARFEFPAEAFDERIEWHTAADLPDREIARGLAAVRAMLTNGWATVADPGLKVEELVDAGDRVLVRWRAWGRGSTSGIQMDWHEVHTYEIRSGRVVEVREYRSWGEALKAVGLSKQDAHADS
jgi:ketosteroid isomerase-like protein